MPRICFILVEPKVPENVGAAARALKTMGFDDLRVVKSTAHRAEGARWLAHGAADVLDRTAAFATLKAALRGCDFAAGATARVRIRRKDYHTPQELRVLLEKKKGAVQSAAVVFGREECGLTNEELDMCDIVTSVPIKARFPSLNLAQAVMVYAYALSPLSLERRKTAAPAGSAEESERSHLGRQAGRLLNELGFASGSSVHRRIMDRIAVLGGIDMRLAHSVITRIARQSARGRKP
jgi:tRNA/rRNA methyltransferase